jgi:hypothetical protein
MADATVLIDHAMVRPELLAHESSALGQLMHSLWFLNFGDDAQLIGWLYFSVDDIISSN